MKIIIIHHLSMIQLEVSPRMDQQCSWDNKGPSLL